MRERIGRDTARRRPRTVIDGRRLVALTLPIFVPPVMEAVFAAGRERFGERNGYLAGFGVYWAACAGLTVGLLGPARTRTLFTGGRSRLGRPAAVGATLLAWPAIGAVATRFLPEVRGATKRELATIEAVAAVNATAEELLWRGVYLTLWPSNPLLGWAWPAVGFGLWHRAPQVIHPSAMSSRAYVAAATALGPSWGWVAWRTGSLRWVTVSHVLTDGSGVRNAAFFLG